MIRIGENMEFNWFEIKLRRHKWLQNEQRFVLKNKKNRELSNNMRSSR